VSESYTKTSGTLAQRLEEILTLYRFHSEDLTTQVADHVRAMQECQQTIEKLLGEPLRNKRILEIGPGQMLKQARYFGADNQVVAVDLDEVIHGWALKPWFRMLRRNGPIRFTKTLARKVLGIDRRFGDEMSRQLPGSARPSIEFVQCDATNTGFEGASFDCAISFSVLEHIPDPALLLREIARLLRPGGVSFHLIHIYSSDSGAHDPRTFAQSHPNVPYWCHLRPSVAHLSVPNSYVNKVSLCDWRTIALAEQPDVDIRTFTNDVSSPLGLELATLRAAGELADYDDEELLTAMVVIAWTKPFSS
jgi:SAM-dependent methyltransferase